MARSSSSCAGSSRRAAGGRVASDAVAGVQRDALRDALGGGLARMQANGAANAALACRSAEFFMCVCVRVCV
jgi:hypothetical protein